KGLEGRWSTHAQYTDRSGTGYVNDFTGNLVFVTPLVNTTGNRMPVSVYLVYDGVRSGKESGYADKTGKGWKLNIQQKIREILSTDTGVLQTLYQNGYRYIYEDEDGTEHYFRLKEGSTTLCEDEEGMGLSIAKNDPVINGERYILESDSGNRMSFNGSGLLYKAYDTNGQYSTIVYATGDHITKIVDGAGREITFTHDANDLITKITDPSERETLFTYSGVGRLIDIEYPDGKHTHYFYDTYGKLTTIRDTDLSRIVYEYEAAGSAMIKNRVVNVLEYDDTNTDGEIHEGNSLAIDYSGMYHTVFTDREGRNEVYRFDTEGRTVSVLGPMGNSYMYTYVTGNEENNKTKNSLKSIGEGEKYVRNLLKNHSFEKGTSSVTNWNASANGVSPDTEEKYIGQRSVKLSSSGTSYISQTFVPVSATTTFTFSAYVKTSSSDTNAYLKMRFLDENGNMISEVNSVTNDYKITNWTRIAVSGTMPEGADRIRVYLWKSGNGDAWYDAAQLEAGYCVNTYDMIENGNFSDGMNNWQTENTASSDGIVTTVSGDKYFRIYGDPYVTKKFSQRIEIGRNAKDTFFRVRTSSKGNSVPTEEGRDYGIGIKAHYTDNTEDEKTVSFLDVYSDGWQETSGIIGFDVNKTIQYAEVFCVYGHNENSVSFDNVRLSVDESGVSYTYDEDGNLLSAKDNAGRTRTFSYSDAGEITNYTSEDNKNYTFTYDSVNKHRLLNAVSVSSDIRYSFNYDSYGNITQVKAQKEDGTGQYIRNNTTYSTSGNYVSSTSNDRGFYEYYDYDETKGTLGSHTDQNGYTVCYSYDADNDQITSMSDTDSSVQYSYNG
ncbi:MAG: hypothetical protein IIY75_08190, partial [Erysipelotrichales bacterium]|nr:hypothetical protein [Erysipelotrichales bacterium]